MSDVGAVVLTLGEPDTDRALASLRLQSLPIDEVAVVKGIRPFHCALNIGAERVGSPFFLQVDADFVLDPDCAATLRNAMAPDVGATVGALRDPLMGPIAGVKLFRRSCFASSRMPDTISPDVDFLTTLERLGWQTRYVTGGRAWSEAHTLGAHRPVYTVDYVFGTYYLLGARYVWRGDALGLLWRFGQLRRSPHPLAPVARVAMAHGMFSGEARDVSKPAPANADASFLRALAQRADSGDSTTSPAADDALRQLDSLSTVALLGVFLHVGSSLRATSHAGFRDCLHALAESTHPRSWLAEVAVAHGALSNSMGPVPRETMATLEQMVSPATPKLFPRPA
jgi:hypothetical protein